MLCTYRYLIFWNAFTTLSHKGKSDFLINKSIGDSTECHQVLLKITPYWNIVLTFSYWNKSRWIYFERWNCYIIYSILMLPIWVRSKLLEQRTFSTNACSPIKETCRQVDLFYLKRQYNWFVRREIVCIKHVLFKIRFLTWFSFSLLLPSPRINHLGFV